MAELLVQSLDPSTATCLANVEVSASTANRPKRPLFFASSLLWLSEPPEYFAQAEGGWPK